MTIDRGDGETSFGFIPWGDEDQFRDLLARTWIYGEEIDWDSFEEEREALGDLLPLLGPMAALQLYGTAEEMARRRSAVLDALGSCPDPPHRTPRRRYRDEEARPVHTFASRIGLVAERLRQAETEVWEAGWRFVPEKRLFRYAGPADGPTQWRNMMARTIYKARFPKETSTGERPSVTTEVRKEVARILRWWLPEEHVDTASGGKLDNALRNLFK